MSNKTLKLKNKNKNKIKIKIKNKNKKIGGQIVPYSIGSPWHKAHMPLWEHDYDCVPNTFYLLGYCSEEDARYMARIHGGLYGFSNTEMLDLINQAYDGRHSFQKIEYPYTVADYLNVPNTATMLSLDWKDGGGHALAIVYSYSEKSNDYEHFILCGQTNQLCLLNDYLEDHDDNIESYSILMSDEIHPGYNEITREMITDILAPNGIPNWETGPWRIVYWYDNNGNEHYRSSSGNAWVCDNTGDRIPFDEEFTINELYNIGMTSFTDSEEHDWRDFIGWKAAGWSGSYGDTIDDDDGVDFDREWYPRVWGDTRYTWLFKNGNWKRQGGGRGLKIIPPYNFETLNDMGMTWFIDNSNITWNKSIGFVSDSGKFGGWIPHGWEPTE